MATAAAEAKTSSRVEKNVTVAVRYRPLSEIEAQNEDLIIVESKDGKSIDLLDPSNKAKTFTFDHVYSDKISQKQIFADIAEPIIKQATKGFNGTIFAYGQTGSGKTYTISGEDNRNLGLIPLMNRSLFGTVVKRTELGAKFQIVVSYLEIYNEVVNDLLNPSSKELKLREHPSIGVYVENLAELVVNNENDIERLLQEGNRVRKMGETKMNKRSSRSHTCFIIRIDQKLPPGEGTKNEVLRSCVNMVDLAGSERADSNATGEQRKEGAHINKSLAALGNVINALTNSEKRHVPYRDSKLTRLLQDSLGGNFLTAMIATISPASSNYQETLYTLEYANRAKGIVNSASKNQDLDSADIIAKLRREINGLRSKLAKLNARDKETLVELDDTHVQKMEENIANLKRAKQQTWEEKERLSQLYKEEREKNLEKDDHIRRVLLVLDDTEKRTKLSELQMKQKQLTIDYTSTKSLYKTARAALEGEVKLYEEKLVLFQEGKTGQKEEQELQQMYLDITKLKRKVQQYRDELHILKKRLRANESEQDQERVSAMVQVDFNKNMKSTNPDEQLMIELQQKRTALADKVSQKKKAAKEEFDAGKMSFTPENFLELKQRMIRVEGEKQSLQLEQKYLNKFHALQSKMLRKDFQDQLKSEQQQSIEMFREMCECFERERVVMESKYGQTATLLQKAVKDVLYYSKRCASLESQLNITS